MREDSANDLIVPDSRWPSPRQRKEGVPAPSFRCTLCNKIANALPIYSVWFRIIPHFSLQLLRRDPVLGGQPGIRTETAPQSADGRIVRIAVHVRHGREIHGNAQ